MQGLTQRDRGAHRRGFSLIEVVIATGIFAMSIVAIIAFLGSISQATTEVTERAVAARLADNVRAELENEDIDVLYNEIHVLAAGPNDPVVLFATKDGERVRLEGNPADTPESDPYAPGISPRNRFFRIELRRLENSLEVASSAVQFQQESAMLPISVQVVWPYHLPHGAPTDSEFTVVAPERQSRYVYNTVILRKQ